MFWHYLLPRRSVCTYYRIELGCSIRNRAYTHIVVLKTSALQRMTSLTHCLRLSVQLCVRTMEDDERTNLSRITNSTALTQAVQWQTRFEVLLVKASNGRSRTVSTRPHDKKASRLFFIFFYSLAISSGDLRVYKLSCHCALLSTVTNVL